MPAVETLRKSAPAPTPEDPDRVVRGVQERVAHAGRDEDERAGGRLDGLARAVAEQERDRVVQDVERVVLGAVDVRLGTVAARGPS